MFQCRFTPMFQRRWRAGWVLGGPPPHWGPPPPPLSLSPQCDRCFIRNCDESGASVPFIEYKWAYFMNLAERDPTQWDSPTDQDAFFRAYSDLPSFPVPGESDLDQWAAVAAVIIPREFGRRCPGRYRGPLTTSQLAVCRGLPAGEYAVPSTLFDGGGGLPGYTEGMDTELEHDPTCDAKTCPIHVRK